MKAFRNAGGWALVAFLLAAQVSATPTVWRCYVTESGWRSFNGKAHCELEGWRWYFSTWRSIL